MMNLMKNKIFSVLVGLLAVFLGACSDDDDVLTTSSVHVNGGPLEESITPTSARVRTTECTSATEAFSYLA